LEAQIHPAAIVHPKAQLGEGTRVGPYCTIDENVRLGRDCDIQEHVVLRGHTQLGDGVRVFPFAVVGAEPQHLKYAGEPTTVTIGNRVVLREGVTVHRGTVFGNHTTRIGDDAYIMAYAHVAHDCVVGKGCILANEVLLGGHVEVQDHAVIGGQVAIAQFCRIGRYCFVAGGSIIRKDLPPFMMGKGNDFRVQGINIVGLTRQGFSAPTRSRLKQLYKIFYLRGLTVDKAVQQILIDVGATDEVKLFLEFVKQTKVGCIR
jgi:UDP-N-acetylglucosamine acyltransferase